ncbi:uncharacterized protein TRAVEDRAFT_20885 [Trametes versicolor FP-101664 SS1]|uniref:uncharacterized protein n=1 Tax=Trametes versicolor (strain FP-101664) TaxID=717944 RepID=UPI000462434D|nr:uncharacterized protein TRAVEDRAFT_20885 [Trametes versicolor FP-101664 SS1]EIW57191.1 hypothetical protein TRAVEDRAFT_20885 [Trametes versicolor FP-101664 SS1]
MSPSPPQSFTLSAALKACAGSASSNDINDKPLRVLSRNPGGVFEVVPFRGQPYVAISYCWPGSPTFRRLSTSNEPTPVLTPSGLVSSQHFSLFISHSAHSYDPSLAVWVDFHCINQNDLNEKTAQVAIMQRIYTGAKLTLVMLEDVALRPEDRLLFAAPRATKESLALACHVLSARWFSRAWCSQELVLSRHAHLYVHDLSQEGHFVSIPSDTLWHIIDSARNREAAIPVFPQPRGSLPDTAMAKSTCAWALGIVHRLGCSDDYDKASLLCNLVRFIYRFASRPTAFNVDSPIIRLNVLKMANIIAFKRRDFSLLLVNHGLHNPLRGHVGFGWAGEPIEGDRASATYALKDFQAEKDPGIMLDDSGLIARGCLARVVQEHTWELHRDPTGRYTRVVSNGSHVHPSWTWRRDALHLRDLLVALASVGGHGWDDASHHARIVFAYLLSIDYDLQPEPITGDLGARTRSLLCDLFSLKDIAAAMSFVWRAPGLAAFSTIRLTDGSVLLVSGNVSGSLVGRLLFQPYVIRPTLFSPPGVLTANSLVLENRRSPQGVHRCIGCVRGLGMISEADGHGGQILCIA